MKSLALIACAALMSVGTGASAAEPTRPAEREKGVMLYFTKSFGSNQQTEPVAAGVRVEAATVVAVRRVAVDRGVRCALFAGRPENSCVRRPERLRIHE